MYIWDSTREVDVFGLSCPNSGIVIPDISDGKFTKRFSEISVEDFNKIWVDSQARDIIKAKLRNPGGMHEWLMVSRADIFKKWGISVEDI